VYRKPRFRFGEFIYERYIMNLTPFFSSSMAAEETMVELKPQPNKKQKTGGEREDERDLLSLLPDDVLLHIMHFMDTDTAVRTSFLSKRWNNLWKCLKTLCFRRRDFNNVVSYNQFIYHVVSQRDTSIRLNRLDLEARIIAQDLLNLVVPLLHSVPHLGIHLDHISSKRFYCLIPQIFASHSLTSLTLALANQCVRRVFKLPHSLELPALKTLNLTNVSFTARDECAEPFSSCLLLNSLVLVRCSLSNPAKVLSISNPNLSRFTMKRYSEVKYKIVLSTPNLTHFAIKSSIFFSEVSSTCDLALLEEANIDITWSDSHAIVHGLLKMLSYAKILALSEYILTVILDVSYFCFVLFSPLVCILKSIFLI